MISVIIALYLLGLVLIFFELFVPGGLLGLLGAMAIFGSWALVFVHLGFAEGIVAVTVGFLVLFIMLALELKFLPRTKMGQKLFLHRAIDSTSQAPVATSDIIGKECEALTSLGPTGVVMLNKKNYEAVSISGFVERGTRLRVVDFDNFRVRVRKL